VVVIPLRRTGIGVAMNLCNLAIGQPARASRVAPVCRSEWRSTRSPRSFSVTIPAAFTTG